MKEIIRFEHVGKSFGGIKALDDVSFSIAQGEVHAIVGENGAGKSTLMNILSGIFENDTGKVLINGEEKKISSPLVARELGIATVFQELMLCNNLDVAGNIFLGREIKKGNGIGPDWKKMREQSKQILDSYGLDISPKVELRNLTVAQQQLLEIARAMGTNAQILILDEPTSSLTENETRKLFDNIRRLKESGMTILFISHRLEEIFRITDRISVMRNGKYITTVNTDEVTQQELVDYIAGKAVRHEQIERRDFSNCEAVLEVENLSDGKMYHKVSFTLHRGEILGFYGLQGSGRTDIVETIYGLKSRTEGKIRLYGKECDFKSPRDAIQAGVGIVTEDRKQKGIFALMSVKDNITIIQKEAILNKLHMLSASKAKKLAQEFVEKISVKTASIEHKITSLSGGNQQKALIARMLSRNPDILLMDEPTRGVDVGAKAEIFAILRNLRETEGKSIIVISSEIDEIIAECDRVLVMHEGTLVGELTGDHINKTEILHLAFQDVRNEL